MKLELQNLITITSTPMTLSWLMFSAPSTFTLHNPLTKYPAFYLRKKSTSNKIRQSIPIYYIGTQYKNPPSEREGEGKRKTSDETHRHRLHQAVPSVYIWRREVRALLRSIRCLPYRVVRQSKYLANFIGAWIKVYHFSGYSCR